MTEGALTASQLPPRERDDSIDIMRATGLLLIILAHTIPGDWTLFQLRNFDVPMMAVISGMAFIVSSPDRISLGSYYWKRVLRLLLPTYVFLILFFAITWICFYAAGSEFPFKDKIYGAFTLRNTESIGYVWIIRVFLLIALMAPLLHAVWKRVRPVDFVVFLIGSYILYEFIYRRFPKFEPEWLNTVIVIYLYYAISYSIIFGVGMLLMRLNWYQRLALAVIFGITWGICVYMFNTGEGIELRMQAYKYPPRIYYVAWGLFMSTVLSLAFMAAKLDGYFGKFLRFLSTANLWIYLWHIAVLYTIEWHPETFKAIDDPWMKFFVVVVVSSLLTFSHRKAIGAIAQKLQPFPKTRKFVTEAFLK